MLHSTKYRPIFVLTNEKMKERISIVVIALCIVFTAGAQESLPTGKELEKNIMRLDSTLFAAFNNRDVALFSSFFSEDLEFYHDLGGLSGYEHTIQSLKNTKESGSDLKRELVKEGMEIHPVPGYGAMQIAAHTFCHTENAKQNCATFRFAHVWQHKEGKWKITRVLSFGH